MHILFKHLSLVLIISCSWSQTDYWQILENLNGKWNGTGEGFSGGQSQIHSEFSSILDGKYLQISNESFFPPATDQEIGEVHKDMGVVSHDKNRNLIVFRQFHNEGFINQYILNDGLSRPDSLIFESEIIENFVDGGRARFTIKIINTNQIETFFDVSFPEQEFSCYGHNKLSRD